MKAIVAKRVTMLELFYDLIFVYAISQITAMIHHPVGGRLPLFPYLEFIVAVIIVMQLWLYQTLYINRFGQSRTIDNLGLLISMYAMTFMANNINTEWATTFRAFNTAFLLIVVNLIGQYLLGSGKHPLFDRDVRAFVITLSLEFLAVLVGLSIGYHYGIYLCVLAGLIGLLMPLVVYRHFVADQVNFPHLVERLSLIIIISFGEALVNVTRYFTKSLLNPLALSIFIFLAAAFVTYLLQIEQLINHQQYSRGFILMYSHVLLVVAVLSLTVGLDYLATPSVPSLFLWSFLSISLCFYYAILYANGIYHHQGSSASRDYVCLALLLVVGLAISFVFRQSNVGIVLGLAVASVGQAGYWICKVLQQD